MENDKPTRPASGGMPAVQQKDWFKKLEAASGQLLELNTQKAWVYLMLDSSGR